MDDIGRTQTALARKAMAVPDHRFDDLYHLICRSDWLETAAKRVLANTGARTPGVDGMTKNDLKTEEQRKAFLLSLQTELKTGIYHPHPVVRIWIPKANGGQRPLGVPTIKDRIVQMMLKMLMEPIWESDFIEYSYGFRPKRRTMDAISWCYRRIQPRTKHFWVIEGDIKGCFDNIDHKILMKQIKMKIKDRRILAVIAQQLRARVLDQELYTDPTTGIPQGGIVSPLLANIYLNAFDKWWLEKYGTKTVAERQRERRNGKGAVQLLRYMDDFILLTSGPKAYAEAVRDEVAKFLSTELHLTLSPEKTLITNAKDGFDFLGFHVEYEQPKNNKPWLRVTPTKRSEERLKENIRTITARERTPWQTPLNTIKAINRVLRGWINYYRHCSVKGRAKKLDWWVNQEYGRWLCEKHKGKGIRWVLKNYRFLENGTRKNLAVRNETGGLEFLFLMSDVSLKPYKPTKQPNPYLDAGWFTLTATPNDDSIPGYEWTGWWPNNDNWLDIRELVIARDGYECTQCHSQEDLEVHHITPRSQGGGHNLENLTTLCKRCHEQTPSYLTWHKKETSQLSKPDG
jgi:RNA-directed DNA polymerase